MIIKFELYKEGTNNLKFIASLFPILYRKAIKNIVNVHQSLTEDHVLEFIIHYIYNDYGIDLLNSKEIYKYVKYLIHKNFKKKLSESSIYDSVDSNKLFDVIHGLNIKKIESLLRKGANANVQNKSSRTPLMIAILSSNGRPSQIIKIINLFVKYGANLDIQDSFGRTALMKATNEKHRKDNFSIVDKLIELDADWGIKDDRGDDFISNLSSNGDIKKIKELQEKFPEKFERYNLRKKFIKYNI